MYELRLFLFIGIYSFGTYLCNVKPMMQGFALPVFIGAKMEAGATAGHYHY